MNACPTCGLDVSGWPERTTRDGQRAWDRPVKFTKATNGTTDLTMGGLSHIEGTPRCLAALVPAFVPSLPGSPDASPEYSPDASSPGGNDP